MLENATQTSSAALRPLIAAVVNTSAGFEAAEVSSRNGLRTSGRSQVSSSLWREASDQLEEKGDSQVPNARAIGHLDRQVKNTRVPLMRATKQQQQASAVRRKAEASPGVDLQARAARHSCGPGESRDRIGVGSEAAHRSMFTPMKVWEWCTRRCRLHHPLDVTRKSRHS